MLGHLQLSVFGTSHVTDTLVGSCGSSPGITCQLVWDLSHNARAASVTRAFLNGPVHLLLRVLFVVLLAFFIQWLVHRVINRLTERAASNSLLSRLRNHGAASRSAAARASAGGRLVAGRIVAGRFSPGRSRRRRRSESDDSLAADAAEARTGAAASSAELADGLAGQAEAALVDERREQRVQALGAILRSASSVTIFAIAGFIILGDLGLNLAPLLASAGVVGIAIGFGAQSLVSDYLTGIFMLVEDQYGVGDVITVGNATGTIENVTLRVTRMRDVNGIVWHIRNGTISTVGNESQGWARAVIDFPVPYAADLTAIRDVFARVGEELWNDPAWRPVMLEAPEVWGAQEITSTGVTMRVVAKTAPLRQWEVEREMRARVKRALAEAEILPAPAETPKMAVTLTRDE